jgi:tetratricopeptide (TPR) repeat protein
VKKLTRSSEPTVADSLQTAIRAQQSGDLVRAEKAYRIVLSVTPEHSDANYLLGRLLIGKDKFEEGFAFLETAVQMRPENLTFWNSYLEVLISQNLTGYALRSIASAEEQGLTSRTIDKLRDQVKSLASRKHPPGGMLRRLVSLYEKGCYESAEELASAINDQYPWHPFASKILGFCLADRKQFDDAIQYLRASIGLNVKDPSLFHKLGFIFQQLEVWDEAIKNFREVLSLDEHHVAAHVNLAICLLSKDELVAAEQYARRAIHLDPNVAEAHNTLGNILRSQHEYEKSEICFRQAIALNPSLEIGYLNLAITLQAQKKFVDAEHNCRAAIAIKPIFPEAHNSLGVVLQSLNNLEEATKSYSEAIEQRPDYGDALLNLSVLVDYLSKNEDSIDLMRRVRAQSTIGPKLRANIHLALDAFLKNQFSSAKKYLSDAGGILNIDNPSFLTEKNYCIYLQKILSEQLLVNPSLDSARYAKRLHILGESHSLVSHNLPIQKGGKKIFGTAHLIKGCKQWHLGNKQPNQYKISFQRLMNELPKQSEVLIAIGEIDCRLDTGILKFQKSRGHGKVVEVVESTIRNFCEYVSRCNKNLFHDISIQGIPCPLSNPCFDDRIRFGELVEVRIAFNEFLKKISHEKGFGFLDVHAMTDRGDGVSNRGWYLDHGHLTPQSMQVAWQSHYAKASKNVL